MKEINVNDDGKDIYIKIEREKILNEKIWHI